MQKIRPYITLLVFTFIFIVSSLILYRFVPKFVESSYFIAFVTFLVGLFAIYIYLSQREDFKRDAANIILMEIRHAELAIRRLKEDSSRFYPNVTLLPTDNWSKYNYLFIKDLDRDELDFVNDFYNRCLLVDKSIKQLDLTLVLEQKSDHIQRILVQMADDELSEADYNIRRDKFIKTVENEDYRFTPIVPQEQYKKALDQIQEITTTTAGKKLKDVAEF